MLEILTKKMKKKLTGDSFCPGIQFFLLKFPNLRKSVKKIQRKFMFTFLKSLLSGTYVYRLTQPLYALSLRYLYFASLRCT